MQEITFDQYAPQVLQQLPKGAFLTVSHDGRDNTMTIAEMAAMVRAVCKGDKRLEVACESSNELSSDENFWRAMY